MLGRRLSHYPVLHGVCCMFSACNIGHSMGSGTDAPRKAKAERAGWSFSVTLRLPYDVGSSVRLCQKILRAVKTLLTMVHQTWAKSLEHHDIFAGPNAMAHVLLARWE